MSSVITQQNQNTVDPILADTLAPLIAKWETAILRVAANDAHPAKFAVPMGIRQDSTEALLAARFAQLPPAKRAAAGTKAAAALGKAKTQRNLSPVVDVARLNNGVSVDDRLVSVAPRKLSAAELNRVAADFAKTNALSTRTLRPKPSQFGTLRLDLQRIVCIDETNGFLGTERGEDEIYMMGTIVDGSTNVGTIAPFYIADFDDGTRHDFTPPLKLVSFGLNFLTQYPKAYFVSLILVEKDHGDLNESLRGIIDKLTKELKTWLGAAIAAAIGGLTGGVGAIVGAAIGYAVSWAVDKVVAFLIRVWEDDLFETVTLSVIIPDDAATLNEPSQVFHFRGPGEYAVRYQWKLSRPNLTHPGEPGKVLVPPKKRPAGGTIARKDPDMITR